MSWQKWQNVQCALYLHDILNVRCACMRHINELAPTPYWPERYYMEMHISFFSLLMVYQICVSCFVCCAVQLWLCFHCGTRFFKAGCLDIWILLNSSCIWSSNVWKTFELNLTQHKIKFLISDGKWSYTACVCISYLLLLCVTDLVGKRSHRVFPIHSHGRSKNPTKYSRRWYERIDD